jgi:hypothetical protein
MPAESIHPAIVSEPSPRSVQDEGDTKQLHRADAQRVSPELSDGMPAVLDPFHVGTQHPSSPIHRSSAADGAAPTESPAAYWSSPLTQQKLEDMPGHLIWTPAAGGSANADGQFAYRMVGDLKFPVHPSICSLESRMRYINAVADFHNAKPESERTTVLSIGAGQLLTEELIHLQQHPSAQSRTKWRPVDTKYANNIAVSARKQFRQDGKDVRVFATVESYLLHPESNELLKAVRDNGEAVTILLCDPPTVTPEDRSKPAPAGGITLHGQPLAERDVKKANEVIMYFEAKTPDGRARLASFASTVSTSQVTSTMIVKCWPDASGAPQFEIGGDIAMFGSMIKPMVSARMQMQSASADKLPIEKLYAGVSTFVSELNAQSQSRLCATCMPFSDFNRSMARLEAHFASVGQRVTVARLENSDVSLTPLRP